MDIFKLHAPDTYLEASEILDMEDTKRGQVRVTRWSQFHFCNSAKRAMKILRVEIIEPKGKRRKSKPL